MLRRCPALLLVFLFTTFSLAQSPQTTASLAAGEIVARWRKAVHPPAQQVTAVLTTTSQQDGIPGHIEEWITSSGQYRRVVKREFDNEEIVVGDGLAQQRDWNGYVRDLQGQELSRLRTAIFETSVIAMGPPELMSRAAVSEAPDGKAYVLTVTPPDAKPSTWYIDRTSCLPLKSVRPGEDTEITTTYSDWKEMGGILTPQSAVVAETDKPEYGWERGSLRIERGTDARNFQPLQPGPWDAHVDPNAPPIPFNFESSHIVFKVSVNGRPPSWFIFDTGADQEVINSTRMAEFGLKTYGKTATTGGGNSAEYDYAEGATFTLPGVEVRNQHVAAMDETGLERALGMPFGGILGFDFISRFIVDIDYEKKLITLHDPKTWTYTGNGYSVPIIFDQGIPFSHGLLSVATAHDIPAYFVLDFGAAETMTLTSPFVKAHDLDKIAAVNTIVNRPAGLEKQFFAQNNIRGHIDQLTLGSLVVRSIPINMSVNTKGAYASKNFSGTIGESIYRRYHAILDYAHNRVILEPTPESSKPFPERETYGLSVLASGSDLHTYTVSAVRPDSPAAKDGFRKGDVIAAMDQEPASQFTLGELRDRLLKSGAHHQLEVVRGAERLTIPVDVRLVSLDRQ